MSGELCPNCGSPASKGLRHCPTCQRDLGFPNVRECGAAAEKAAVRRRATQAREDAEKRDCEAEFLGFENALEKQACVVVSMEAGRAMAFMEDPRETYANYETLVGAGVRKPAAPENDRHRTIVASMLYGSYGNMIRYGVLSLCPIGLPTYGEVHLRLKDVAIRARVSFTETNSFAFVKEHNLRPGASTPPPGHRAVWDNRQELALAKLGRRLKKGDGSDVWQELLVASDGQNREKDDFVEAHIFDHFDCYAVEDITVPALKDLGRTARSNARLAIAAFKRRQARNSVT